MGNKELATTQQQQQQKQLGVVNVSGEGATVGANGKAPKSIDKGRRDEAYGYSFHIEPHVVVHLIS